MHAGLVPVLADVDTVTGTVSPATCAAAARDVGGVHAMLALHFAGYPADVAALAEAAGLTLDDVVEDAAHALGTRVGDELVGGLSRATCFSFYATKNLPIGEGGMLTTRDEELAARARGDPAPRDDQRRLASLPSRWQLALLRRGAGREGQPVRHPCRHRSRAAAPPRRVAAAPGRARGALRRRARGMVPGVRTARPPLTGVEHAWHLYVVRVAAGGAVARDDLSRALAERGIGTSVHFIPLHHFPHFSDACMSRPADCPGPTHVFAETLSLPLHQGLTDDDVDAVIEAVAIAVDLAPSAVRSLPGGTSVTMLNEQRPLAARPRTGGTLRTLVVGAGEAGPRAGPRPGGRTRVRPGARSPSSTTPSST